MAVDYNDERLVNVENEKNNAINEVTNEYNNMINNSDKFYQKQIEASKDYANKQTEIQNAQTNLAIQEVNQQKDKAQKDYIKEQKGAYTDYQKATNQYGVNAEKLATQGLNSTGYSESTRTNAYNTYQNRYATAKEAYNNAVLNYDNSIKEIRLANNSTLAQIAYEALKTQLELSLEGFQYKNTLIQTKMNAVDAQKDRYHSRYQDVLNQINTENALAEQQRQFNASLAEQKRQFNASLSASKSRSSGGNSSGGGSVTLNNTSTTYEVNTPYYQGNINPDAKKYGTFKNSYDENAGGYQPKGISGHGEVSKTGKTITINTQTLSGENKKVKQNVWKTSDNKKWIWDGRYNEYVEYVEK